MKKEVIAVAAAFMLLAALLCACSQPVSGTATEPAAGYRDGTYQYSGDADGENYHVEATMVVEGGAIKSMEWKIVDDNRGRDFDETYEEVYTGNEVYMQQSRDNWNGMQDYVPSLLETQDPDEVDAITGATWAYNKFEEAAKALLKQASGE